MKRSILAAAAVLLMATTANAGPSPSVTQPSAPKLLATSGHWKVEYFERIFPSGQPMCGIHPKTARSDSSYFSLKYTTVSGLWVHLHKPGWKIPAGTKVQALFTFDETTVPLDGNSWIVVPGHKTESGKSNVSFRVDDEFRELLANSSALNVAFVKGTEKPWSLNLSGVRGVLDTFKTCVADIVKSVPQPFDPADAPKDEPSSVTGAASK